MKKIISLIAVMALLVLTLGCTQYHAKGAGVGGAVGGAAGAMLDKDNAWRGGVIGAVLGAIAGATLTDISMQASQDAIRENRPVEYRTSDGRGVYRADQSIIMPGQIATRFRRESGRTNSLSKMR